MSFVLEKTEKKNNKSSRLSSDIRNDFDSKFLIFFSLSLEDFSLINNNE